MTIEIIKHGHRVEKKSYHLHFSRISDPSCGFMFDCDEIGTVLDMTDLRLSTYTECMDSGEYYPPEILCSVNRYWEPTKARCECGKVIYLEDPMDNECSCGRCYNMGGQRVTPMSECRHNDDY